MQVARAPCCLDSAVQEPDQPIQSGLGSQVYRESGPSFHHTKQIRRTVSPPAADYWGGNSKTGSALVPGKGIQGRSARWPLTRRTGTTRRASPFRRPAMARTFPRKRTGLPARANRRTPRRAGWPHTAPARTSTMLAGFAPLVMGMDFFVAPVTALTKSGFRVPTRLLPFIDNGGYVVYAAPGWMIGV
jgi:hypothetical protein